MERQTLQITDNLERLLDIFPRTVRKGLEAHEDDLVNLIEVVMDLGRLPQARWQSWKHRSCWPNGSTYARKSSRNPCLHAPTKLAVCSAA